MNERARLSLQTVSLMHRAVALVPALLTAMFLFVPALSLTSEVQRESSLIDDLWRAFVWGASFMVEGLPYVFLIGLLFWGLPGFVLLHFVLKWLRGSFLATVIAGALCGAMGLLFMNPISHGSVQMLVLAFFNPTLRLEDLIVGTICGGAGAAMAWCYMWLASRRRRRIAA